MSDIEDNLYDAYARIDQMETEIKQLRAECEQCADRLRSSSQTHAACIETMGEQADRIARLEAENASLRTAAKGVTSWCNSDGSSAPGFRFNAAVKQLRAALARAAAWKKGISGEELTRRYFTDEQVKQNVDTIIDAALDAEKGGGDAE